MSTQKQTAEVFNILSKGSFICSNSTTLKIRKLYNYIDENYNKLYDYFNEINFILERGDEYFYFSKEELKADLQRKLNKAFMWIDILDFFKAYKDSFGPGFRIKPSDISVNLGMNVALKEKLMSLEEYTGKGKFIDRIEKLIELLRKEGFADLENELTNTYKILASFSYLEDLVMNINIPEEIQNEIPE